MNKYKIFLLFPIFKNNKFCQNQIFNQKNFISRSLETRSLVQALDGTIIFERIVNIYVPKPPLLVSKTIANEIRDNFNIDKIDEDTIKLMKKRVIDATACTNKNVTVMLNNEKIA